MNRLIIILITIMLSSCAYNPDNVSMFLVNERLSKLEDNQKTIYVWIKLSNGSDLPIKLIKSNGYFVGPKGEYYKLLPTEEQLRTLYGK